MNALDLDLRPPPENSAFMWSCLESDHLVYAVFALEWEATTRTIPSVHP